MQISQSLKHHQSKMKRPTLGPSQSLVYEDGLPLLQATLITEHTDPNWTTHSPRLQRSLRACDSAVPVPAANMGIVGVSVEVSAGVLEGHPL